MNGACCCETAKQLTMNVSGYHQIGSRSPILLLWHGAKIKRSMKNTCTKQINPKQSDDESWSYHAYLNTSQ